MFGDDDADAGGDQHHAQPGERPQLSPDRDDVAALANQHQLRIRRVRLWTTTAILAERSRFPANIEAERTTINVKSMNMKRLLGPVHKVGSLSAHPGDAAHGRREHTVSTPLPDDNTIFGKCGSEVGFDEAPYQRRPPAIRHAIDDAQPVGELDHHRTDEGVPLQGGNHAFLSGVALVERHSDLWNRTVPVEQIVEESGVGEVEE